MLRYPAPRRRARGDAGVVKLGSFLAGELLTDGLFLLVGLDWFLVANGATSVVVSICASRLRLHHGRR